ncbi:MAG: hypothetical protein ACYDIC_12100, partial [Desulfobaccales bacterium]
THLAGRITLDRFHALINTLNRCFPFYLPLISPLLRPAAESGPQGAAVRETAPSPACSRAVRRDLLAAALGRLRGVLPRRAHSKLQAGKLADFLGRTCGRWFRLRDFQEHFSVESKTAWEYVQKLWSAGILCHNRGRAAAVRYGLADDFLRVRGKAIREYAAAALGDLAPHLGPGVGDLLIAGGGEPFWEEEWRQPLSPEHLPDILQRLGAPASLLEVVSATPGGNRLLRLRSCWLQSPGETSATKPPSNDGEL